MRYIDRRRAFFLDDLLEGLQHFDLRPGGEVDVSGALRVVLYKVVPLAPDELERTRDEGGSQWVDAGAADPDAANGAE